jgi:hypothetical protein
MKFKELLEVLDSDEQLTVTVTNEWGDGVYKGSVEHFKEEELLSNLKVNRIFTHIIEDYDHSDVCYNRATLISEIEVTLFDEEQTIIYPED